MSRDRSIERATRYFNGGEFLSGLRDLVSVHSESQNPESKEYLDRYLGTIGRKFEACGFTWRKFENPASTGAGFCVAERIEDSGLPTILMYGHGDVVLGMDERWSAGLKPWTVTVVGDKWYGRGTADNKGQHWTVLSALKCLLDETGRLGFNVRFLLEMGEEIGSPGLHEFCRQHKPALKADVLLASDGPRQRAERPTIFMGSRGSVKFNLRARLREREYHSGNWGGVLKDPVIRLSNAIATIVDAKGRILVDGWKPAPLDARIKQALSECTFDDVGSSGDIDLDWGEPGLTPVERLYAWNSFSVLAIHAGNVKKPVNAIQGEAVAVCQLRFVVGLDPRSAIDRLRGHLTAAGFDDIAIEWDQPADVTATRLDLSDPWVDFVADSIRKTTGGPPVRLPNLAGGLPNDCFSEILGLPTVWIPHSYPGCAQHAPDEHALAPVLLEGLQIMTGLFWDLGHTQTPAQARAPQ